MVCLGMWLSLVERLVRNEEVAGSNPVIPTTVCRGVVEVSFLNGIN